MIAPTSGSAAGGWEPWTSESDGSTTPGAPIAEVATDQNRVALFVTDSGGGISTRSYSSRREVVRNVLTR